MAKEEEIRHLAHAIWEKEECPEGRADEHWRRAKQFLENQEVAEAAGAPSLASLSKQSEYHFNFSFAVAMMAIGTALVFLSPPVTILGLSSIVMGGILSLLSLVLIIASAVALDLSKFHARQIKWGFGVMLVGIIVIPVVALFNYYRPGTFPSVLQSVGLVAFVLGLYIAIFSQKRHVFSKKTSTRGQ